MQKGKSLETWIEQAENTCRTHTAFDVVFTALIYGSLDVHKVIDIETTQFKYSQPNVDTDHDPLHTLHTVTLDLDILLNSIWLAVTIQAVEVAEMIGDEVSNEFRDTLLELSQIRKLAQTGGYPAEFLVEWSFEFTNSNQRTAAVETKYHERIGEALSACKEYRNLIRQRLPGYKNRREVKIQEVSRIIESDLRSSNPGYQGPVSAPAGQGEVVQGTERWKGSRNQAGLPVIEDMDTSNSEASPGMSAIQDFKAATSMSIDLSPTSRTTGMTVAATKTTSQHSKGNVADIFADIEHAAAVVPTSNTTHPRSTRDSVSDPHANIALNSQALPAGTRVLKLKMLLTDPDSHDEAPPTLPMSNSKIKKATNQAEEQTANDPSTIGSSAPASAYERQSARGRPRPNKRSASGKEFDDTMGGTVVPRAKQARTNKQVPASLPQHHSYDTEEAAIDQSGAMAQPMAVIRKAPNPRAEPGRATLKNTLRTTGTPAEPFEAPGIIIAGPTGPPVRRILPALSSLNLPAGTNLPVPIPPSQDAPTSDRDRSTEGQEIDFALAQPSDSPDTFNQSWLPYWEAPFFQNESKPPTALMSRAEGKKAEANIIMVAAGLPPGARDGLEYAFDDVLGSVIEESTTPPESPPAEILQAYDTGNGKTNANQPGTASVAVSAPTTTPAASNISHKPNITGLAPYLDPSARSSALGRLLAQLPSPAITAPAPSTAASDITFPDMQAAKKTSTGKARAEQPNKPTRKAPAPKAVKLDVDKKSKAATAKAMAQLKATIRKLTADIAAIETASQNAASASLPQTATAVSTVRPIPVLPVPAATTTQVTPTQTAPTLASNTRAAPSRAPSARATSTRATSTRAAYTRAATTQAATAQATTTQATTTQAARAPTAITQATATQSSTNAPATTVPTGTTAPAATATPATAPAAMTQTADTQVSSSAPVATPPSAATTTSQPAPAPRRSAREHKGQRTTKHYGR